MIILSLGVLCVTNAETFWLERKLSIAPNCTN